jgi:hypothetical protein
MSLGQFLLSHHLNPSTSDIEAYIMDNPAILDNVRIVRKPSLISEEEIKRVMAIKMVDHVICCLKCGQIEVHGDIIVVIKDTEANTEVN